MSGNLVKIGVAAWVGAMVFAPVSAADPADPAVDPAIAPAAAPAENASAPDALAVAAPSVNPAGDACKLFNAALNVAAANYEDFAYATAGNGNYVDYQDQTVVRNNVIGRTALRQAAAAALSASATPGIPPEVSAPMRSWSLGATKLLLVMGLHGGGDTLNNSVAEMNVDANNAQMACVVAGR